MFKHICDSQMCLIYNRDIDKLANCMSFSTWTIFSISIVSRVGIVVKRLGLSFSKA